MVVGVFPALKLGVLFVKQISKPIAKFLVNQAKNHPVFRTYFIIPPAQFYHWMEVTTKMYIMNLGKPTKVAKLNETMAIELGANLMGEVIIFSVAGGCLLLEYNRQVLKETKREEARLQQIQKFTDDIDELNKVMSQQGVEILYLQEAVKSLAKHTKHELPVKPVMTEINERKGQARSTDKLDSNTSLTSTETDENENRSLIERAIGYFQSDVKPSQLT